MLGAIAGDVIGSVYEWNNIKTKDFPLFGEGCFFTDDTVLTVALAEVLLCDGDCAQVLKKYYSLYPDAGYGGRFRRWAQSDNAMPYGSWGNGAAMRISPVAYACPTFEDVMQHAARLTAVTHNHPEGIKGAQATAAAIYIGRHGGSKSDLRSYVEHTFGYDLSASVEAIRPDYRFDESSQGTVPQALVCFLESTDFEDAIRNAISLGGDSDTLACITGAIAEGFYGPLPASIAQPVWQVLDDRLREVVGRFLQRYGAAVCTHPGA